MLKVILGVAIVILAICYCSGFNHYLMQHYFVFLLLASGVCLVFSLFLELIIADGPSKQWGTSLLFGLFFGGAVPMSIILFTFIGLPFSAVSSSEYFLAGHTYIPTIDFSSYGLKKTLVGLLFWVIGILAGGLSGFIGSFIGYGLRNRKKKTSF